MRALALMVHLSAEVTTLTQEAFGATIRSNLQIATVFAVERHCGIRPGDLAAELDVLPPSISRALNALADAGLVDLAPDADDGRARQVRLTPQGSSRLASYRASMLGVQDFGDVREIPRLLGTPASPGPPADFEAALSALTVAGRRANAALAKAARGSIVGPHNVLDRWIVLTLYWGGVAPRPSLLAEWLQTSRPRMTAHLNTLEGDGLLKKLRHKELGDRRLVDLALTRDGRASGVALFRAFEEHAEDLGRALADFAAARPPSGTAVHDDAEPARATGDSSATT